MERNRGKARAICARCFSLSWRITSSGSSVVGLTGSGDGSACISFGGATGPSVLCVLSQWSQKIPDAATTWSRSTISTARHIGMVYWLVTGNVWLMVIHSLSGARLRRAVRQMNGVRGGSFSMRCNATQERFLFFYDTLTQPACHEQTMRCKSL